MKKRYVLTGDTSKLPIERSRRSALALLLLLMFSATAIGQLTPGLPQAAKDAAAARITPPGNQAMPAAAAQMPPRSILTAISTSEESDRIVVSVATQGAAEYYTAFTLSNPRRLVVDFTNAEISLPFSELPVNLANLKQIRVRQFRNDGIPTARLVFDLNDVKRINHKIVADGQSVRIYLPVQESAAQPPAKESAPARSTAPVKAEPSASKAGVPAKQQDSSAKPGASEKSPESTKVAVTPKSAAGSIQKPATENAVGTAEKTPATGQKPDGAARRGSPSPGTASVPKPAPGEAARSDKPAASSKTEPPAPRATADRKPGAPEPTTASMPAKSAAAEKPAAAKTEPVAPKVAADAKPKSPAPATSPDQAKNAPAPKPEAPRPQAAGTANPQPPGATDAVKPARPTPPDSSVAQSKTDQTTIREVPAPKPVPTATTAKASAAPAPPLQVAEIHGSGLAVAITSQKPETAPARALPQPPPPVQAPPQSGRFGGAPLTLDLVDIPLVDFFRLMAEEGGINVVMDPEISGRISMKVVKVPWDQILEAALANNGLDKLVEGNLVRIAKKTTLQAEAKQREELKKANLLAADTETIIKRLNYAKAASFIPALTEQKTVRGTVVIDERSNALVITDIPSSLERLISLIDSLDQPQPQVEIEARIVAANRDFARDLGIQFGFVQGNLQRTTVGGPNTFGTIGGTRPSATPTSTFAAGNAQTGRGASEDKGSASAGVSPGRSGAGNFNVNLPAGVVFGGVGLSVGNILDTFLLDVAITAGESKGVAKLISQPKVTAQNNFAATIMQGLRFPVQIVSNNTVSVQFQNAALTLIVTPQITLEGNIVLDLHVENNTPDFSRQVNGIPSIRISESQTRVLVRDGGTTVIGGIIVETESNSSDKVPGMASLPLVGNLFKRTSASRSSQEVIFFVTPKIIK